MRTQEVKPESMSHSPSDLTCWVDVGAFQDCRCPITVDLDAGDLCVAQFGLFGFAEAFTEPIDKLGTVDPLELRKPRFGDLDQLAAAVRAQVIAGGLSIAVREGVEIAGERILNLVVVRGTTTAAKRRCDQRHNQETPARARIIDTGYRRHRPNL